mgnify:FL=1
MKTPEYTITREAYDKMVENLCGQIATLELLVDFAVSQDSEFEEKFNENWKHHPKITIPAMAYFKKGEV